MTFHSAIRVAYDGLAKTGAVDRLDRPPGLLPHLSRHCLLERLSNFDHAAGQGVEAVGWCTRATHHKNLAIVHDGSAHSEVGTIGIRSCVRVDLLKTLDFRHFF